jgi:hypothetical protein
MFQSADGKMHFLAPFDAPDGWHMLHANLSDVTATMITGQGVGEGHYCYDPKRNVMHMTNWYDNGYWSMYNLATNKVTLLLGPTYPINNIIVGTDGMIWASYYGNNPSVMSYDPNTGVLNANWSSAIANSQGIISLGADANYVYCGCRAVSDASGYFLAIINRSTKAVTIFNYNQGDQKATVAPGADGKYYYYRRTSSGAESFYAISSGQPVKISGDPGMTEFPKFNCAADDAVSHQTWENQYGWEVNSDLYVPLQGTQEYSQLKFRHPVGSGAWTTASAPYTGPWGANPDAAVVGLSPTQVVSAYTYLVLYDYVNHSKKVMGQTNMAVYNLMRYDATGEVYINGYSRMTMRYDPTKPYTLTASNVTPYKPNDPNRPNPYMISTVDSGHHHFASDYDANGLVWIASNYTRTGADYGVLLWYNPVDGTSGTVAGLQNILNPGAIKMRALVATNQRTKICVSGEDSKIYVIDAKTKTLDHTITLAPNLFDAMIEVADDQLLVVQASVDDSSGNVSRVTKLFVSTGDIIFDHTIGVAGWAFGFQSSNSEDRYNWRLIKGLDNFGWMFVGDHLYRIDPSSGVFSKVSDTAHGSMVFNGADLMLYATSNSDFYDYPAILTPVK